MYYILRCPAEFWITNLFKQVVFKYPITTVEASCSPLFCLLIIYVSTIRPVSSHQPKVVMSPSSSERWPTLRDTFVYWIPRGPKCGRFWKEFQNIAGIERNKVEYSRFYKIPLYKWLRFSRKIILFCLLIYKFL